MSLVEPTRTATATDRLQLAVATTIEAYRSDVDADPGLRVVRLEVRFRPGGSVRAVMLSRESEFEND